MQRRAFTLIELLLVIGIMATLASIVIVAINPTRQLAQARDTARRVTANQIQKGIAQYAIDHLGETPGSLTVPIGQGAAVPICALGVSDPSCTDLLTDLVPLYVPEFAADSAETNPLFSGFSVYLQNGFTVVQANHVELPSQNESSVSSSSFGASASSAASSVSSAFSSTVASVASSLGSSGGSSAFSSAVSSLGSSAGSSAFSSAVASSASSMGSSEFSSEVSSEASSEESSSEMFLSSESAEL